MNGSDPSYLDGLGAKWQEMPALASFGRVIFGLGLGTAWRTFSSRHVEPWQF
jgi:hypothetical protein